MSKQMQILIQGPDGTISTSNIQVGAGRGGQPLVLRALSDVSYEIRDTEKGVAPDQLLIRRHGKNLELILDADGQQASSDAPADIVIEGYYDLKQPPPLTGLSENGQYYHFVPQEGQAELLPWAMEDGATSYQGLGYEAAGSVVPWWPFLLGGLLLLGGAAAAGGGGDGSSGSGGAAALPAPDAPQNVLVSPDGTIVTGQAEAGGTVTVMDAQGVVLGAGVAAANGMFAVVINPAQTNGETLQVTVGNSDNTSEPTLVFAPDTTAPDQPDNISINTEGTVVSGSGEPGTTVLVTDPDGHVVGTGTVDANGDFYVDVDPPQTNGEALVVTLVDAAGNESPAANVTAFDSTAPDVPTSLVVSGDGTTVIGEGEPGAVVSITDADGNPLTIVSGGTVDVNGNFSAVLATSQTDGEQLKVSLTDGSGNTSAAADVTAPDTTPPAAASNLAVEDDGATVTGEAEPGATIVVKDPDGDAIGTGTVSPDGSFSIDLLPVQANGQLLTITVTDAAGNTSLPATVMADDITAPDAPGNLTVNATGDVVSGSGEPGAVVIILDAAGNPLTVVSGDTVDANGNFSATIDPPQTNGEVLSVQLMDNAGNQSAGADVAAPDTTAPMAADNLSVIDNGNMVSGEGEPETSVIVLGEDGNQIGQGVVDGDGNFSIVISPAQTNGETLQVILKDAAGNESLPANVDAADTTPPAAPTHLAVSDDGTELTGRGEAGSTITVLDSNDNDITLVGSVIVAGDGTFTVMFDTPQKSGQTLRVILTDEAGNVSDPATTEAPQEAAPARPDNLQVNATGDELSGDGEPDAEVVVRTLSGEQIGTGTVGAGGQFVITLSPPQINGETLQVTQANSGGTSLPALVTAPDTLPPDAPDDLQVSANGAVLTGTGQPGATVQVKDAGDNPLGSAVVNEEGAFSVSLTPPQRNGETLSVTLSDEGGDSAPGIVDAPDITAPLAATDLQVSPDGLTVTGSGEPGATVQVSDPDNNVLGTAIVDGGGQFSVTLSVAQVNGEHLTVVLNDDSNNTSPSAAVTAPDITAPDPAVNLLVSTNGLTVTGSGEAGAAVSIRDADDNQLGSGVVGSNGQFSVVLDTAQTNGETLTVLLEDGSGNISAPATVDAKDSTPPAAPADLTVSVDGLTVSGTGEPGCRVDIYDAGNVLLGSGTVANNGSFSVAISPAQTNGETVSAILVDGADNSSLPASAIAPDTTAPAAATDLNVSINGMTLTGKGEAGATVSVKDAGDNELGTAVVGSNGQFTVNLSPAQTNGETLNVTLTDSSNNTSAPASVNAKDTTPPEAATDLDINPEGTSMTGRGEEGSNVTVKGPGGTVLGQGVVDEYGDFIIALEPAQTNGQMLSVTLTDAAGNVSGATLIDAFYSVLAGDNSETIALSVTPEINSQDLQTESESAVLIADLGTVTANTLRTEGVIEINVAENTIREVTFQGRGGGLLSIADFDLYIYKANATGAGVSLYSETQNWFYSPLIGITTSGEATFVLEAGDYFIFMSSDSDVSLASTKVLSTTADTVYDYADPEAVSGSLEGNVISDSDDPSGIPANATITEVNSVIISPDSEGTEISGSYGTLLIKPDGSYTYTLNENFADSPTYGAAENFSYTVTAPNGKGSDTATLTINLDFETPAEPPSPLPMAGRAVADDYDGLDFDALDEEGTTTPEDMPPLDELITQSPALVLPDESSTAGGSWQSADQQAMLYLADFQAASEQDEGGVQI